MLDWQGLFKFSQQYVDGTAPSAFTAMSEEDRKFIEEALKEYTTNEVDVMKQIIPILVDHKEQEKAQLIASLEDLQDLIDNHERNSINLERMNGFKALMDVMFNNQHPSVRKLAMMVFSA